MKSLKGVIATLVVILFVILPTASLAATPSSLSSPIQQQIQAVLQEINAIQNEIQTQGNSTKSVEFQNVAVLQENSNTMLYGTEMKYDDEYGVTHLDDTLSSFILSNDPHAPFGVTFLEVNAITELLSKINVETTLSTSTTDPSNWTLNAAYGRRWFEWRVGNNFVTTDQGRVDLAGDQMAGLGGDPGHTMTAFFPLREVITLLGGKVMYASVNQEIEVKFASRKTTPPPFYVP